MRISDWSSDVCSSDLRRRGGFQAEEVSGPGAALRSRSRSYRACRSTVLHSRAPVTRKERPFDQRRANGGCVTETTRTETDSLGAIPVPADAYWGAQTQRSIENFPSGATERMQIGNASRGDIVCQYV